MSRASNDAGEGSHSFFDVRARSISTERKTESVLCSPWLAPKSFDNMRAAFFALAARALRRNRNSRVVQCERHVLSLDIWNRNIEHVGKHMFEIATCGERFILSSVEGSRTIYDKARDARDELARELVAQRSHAFSL